MAVMLLMLELSMIVVSEFSIPFLSGHETITFAWIISGVAFPDIVHLRVYTAFNPVRIVVAFEPGGPILSDPPVIA